MQIQTTNSDPCMDVSGDRGAVLEMKEVLSLRLPSFYRCALRLLGNTADAEDAVQEALLAAYQHIDLFRGQSLMTTWLTTIVRNCALMQLRKRPPPDSLAFGCANGRGNKMLRLGKTRRHAPQPGSGVSQFGAHCTPAKMRRTVVAYFAENISAACLDGALDLGDGSNSWTATGNGQGSTGARSKKDCAAHAAGSLTKIAQAPAPGPIVLPRRNAFPLTVIS
jgi:hypothetical protein